MKRKLLRICALLGALAMGLGAAEEAVDLLEVDHRLYELGYRDGACSGELDDVMINALENFQKANGLGVTGQPDAGTVFVLNSEAAVSQSDYLTRLSNENAGADVLENGARSDEVARLQRALSELGYFSGSASGIYDDATAAAVSRFQLANGLEKSGVADGAVSLRLFSGSAITWEDFLSGSTASAGDSGAKVRTLQYWLQCKGYFEGECTGKYGEETQRAVRQFQSDSGLEVSGDADIDTCRALFADINALLSDATTLHRGAVGAEAEELCQSLAALGYAVHDAFDLQAELALMQFQQANALPVTGTADAATLARLGDPDAVGAEGYAASGVEAALEEGFDGRIVRHASRLLGQISGFDDDFSLVQYVYLKCGVAVEDRSQFIPVGTELGEAAAGDMMVLKTAGGELCGVTASDGALIYRAEGGRILMVYPESMGFEAVRIYRLVLE